MVVTIKADSTVCNSLRGLTIRSRDHDAIGGKPFLELRKEPRGRGKTTDGERVKKSPEPFSMLEGMFHVVKSSPVSAESTVTWMVYEVYNCKPSSVYCETRDSKARLLI